MTIHDAALYEAMEMTKPTKAAPHGIGSAVLIAVTLAVLLGSVPLARRATAADGDTGLAGPWAEALNSKSRLIGGSVEGRLYGGVEISMLPGWKTYWRYPGESGVPPEFDFSASENLKSAEVRYPVPRRIVDPKAGDAIGYEDHVIFPVELVAADTSAPIKLRGKVTYGVCKELCVPAELDVELTVPIQAASSSELAAVVAKVPSSPPAAGAPALKTWRVSQTDGKPSLVLDVSSASTATADVFLVPPAGTYLGEPKRVGKNDGVEFSISLTDGVSITDLKGKPIDVVVVDEKGQSQTTITLE